MIIVQIAVTAVIATVGFGVWIGSQRWRHVTVIRNVAMLSNSKIKSFMIALIQQHSDLEEWSTDECVDMIDELLHHKPNLINRAYHLSFDYLLYGGTQEKNDET